MARATWKRPGSPIGKKGPRKANPSYKRRSRQRWSDKDLSKLRQLAKGNTPTGVMSIKLQRPATAIRSKAHREDLIETHKSLAIQSPSQVGEAPLTKQPGTRSGCALI